MKFILILFFLFIFVSLLLNSGRKRGMLHLSHPLFLAPADGLGNKRRPVERLDYSSRILPHASPTISTYR